MLKKNAKIFNTDDKAIKDLIVIALRECQDGYSFINPSRLTAPKSTLEEKDKYS